MKSALATLGTSEPNEASFAEHYDNIGEQLANNRIVSHAWNEFREILLPDGWSDPPKVRNAQSPGEYFYRSSVVGGRVNLRFYNSLPNLFTGLGILGTFIGLVAGIYLAGNGLGSDDPELVQAALRELLGGASLAFMTSIAGLVSSIGFNVAEKRRLHALDRLTGQFVAALDTRLARVTVEGLASEQLEQSKQQTLTFKQFSSELAFQIADELGKKFTSDLGPTLEKLIGAVEDMRDQRKDDTTELLEKMLGEFQQSLSGSAGKELEALGTTLDRLNDKLGDQISTMTTQQDQMRAEGSRTLAQLRDTLGESTKEFHAEMTRTLSNLNDTLGAAVKDVAQELRSAGQDAGTRLTEMATRLKVTIESINETIQSSAAAAEQHRQIAESNRETIAEMSEAAQHFGRLAEPVAESAKAIDASSASMSNAADQVNSAQQNIHQSVERIESIQAQLAQDWRGYEERFSSVDDSLAKVFTELESGLAQYTATVNGFVGGLDSHTSQITQNLAGSVQELNETLEELQDTLADKRRRA
ncbi:hypothetical protein SADO_06307 [Salinisphaera dokdonensis CL-ES53]|uniref:MotA/TolQ/ExbB proton channel domain-containing protein n=1 Tax=Salinisphaera dokdonensis CL-ES53 TaxID=1304272 RepID=A0ABV2AYY0_9GAMM